MLRTFTILFAMALCACNQEHISHRPESIVQVESKSLDLPGSFTVIEQQPQGLFIRLASSEHASIDMIRKLSTSLDGKFDRIDLCIDIAHERGDEYAAIIAGKLYDYQNDTIYSLNPISD